MKIQQQLFLNDIDNATTLDLNSTYISEQADDIIPLNPDIEESVSPAAVSKINLPIALGSTTKKASTSKKKKRSSEIK